MHGANEGVAAAANHPDAQAPSEVLLGRRKDHRLSP
jgi:hypothetical protein